MTIALCFKCGDTKFGALLECQKCDAPPTGNISLDILFTDHKFSVETLSEFGDVIKAISSASDDDALGFSAFLLYISNNYKEILTVNYDDQKTALCDALLEKANVPLITIE
jgi:hypothetical protein